jgi:hypothetical protein
MTRHLVFAIALAATTGCGIKRVPLNVLDKLPYEAKIELLEAENDLALAVDRHATSKLPDGDLSNIATLGFRGEALPSIGSVARLTITSRAEGEADAHSILVEGGAVGEVMPAGFPGPHGARVEVRDLFYATPARLKFMKSERSEALAIAEEIKHQPRMKIAEAREAVVLDPVEHLKSPLGVALPCIGPGVEQDGGDVALATTAGLVEGVARGLPLLGLDGAGGEGEMGEAVLLVAAQDAFGEGEGFAHVAVGERGNEGPLHQLAIVGVEPQGFAKIGGGGEGVAIRARDQGRQIIARRAGADLEARA